VLVSDAALYYDATAPVGLAFRLVDEPLPLSGFGMRHLAGTEVGTLDAVSPGLHGLFASYAQAGPEIVNRIPTGRVVAPTEMELRTEYGMRKYQCMCIARHEATHVPQLTPLSIAFRERVLSARQTGESPDSALRKGILFYNAEFDKSRASWEYEAYEVELACYGEAFDRARACDPEFLGGQGQGAWRAADHIIRSIIPLNNDRYWRTSVVPPRGLRIPLSIQRIFALYPVKEHVLF